MSQQEVRIGLRGTETRDRLDGNVGMRWRYERVSKQLAGAKIGLL